MSSNSNQDSNFFSSGGPGTTGREVFEDSTASGPGDAYRGTAGGVSGAGTGIGSGTGFGSGFGGNSGNIGAGGLGSAGQTGVGAGQGIGAGYGNTAGQAGQNDYGSVAPTSATAHSGHHGHHGHHHGHGTDSSVNPGTGGLSGANSGVGQATSQTTAEGYGGSYQDKVGGLGQGQAAYEGNPGSGGPLSSGAAGTDRFDSDRSRSNAGTGNVSDIANVHDRVNEDTSQRAPGKSSGGIAGVFATSDKDFTGRDRLGSGAYADTHGPFQGNTTGPGGNTALTGREGTIENNPVAQAKSRASTEATSTGGAGATGSGASAGSPTEKKGFMQKVKDALN